MYGGPRAPERGRPGLGTRLRHGIEQTGSGCVFVILVKFQQRYVKSHRNGFTRAVSVGNPREFLQAEKEDQEMAEACKRLIKNCIICWNYLYLSQKFAEIDDLVKREDLKAVAHGLTAAWEHPRLFAAREAEAQHVNFLGEYDLSEENFKDSVGIKPPKLTN